jgi:hypothetical protein
MRYIKLYESFNKSGLEKELDKYGIRNYTINDDGTIDVNGDVLLISFGLKKIPFTFGKVTGDFRCNSNKLGSLEGCPYFVGGCFDCTDNELTNLIGSPIEVLGSVDCSINSLESLEGMPLEIGMNFGCDQNPNLKELDSVSNIEGDILCDTHVDITKFLGYCKEIDNG